MSEMDTLLLAINKPSRYKRLTSAEREAAEERMMTYLANSDDEEEAFLDSGDEYTPEDDGNNDDASDAEMEIVAEEIASDDNISDDEIHEMLTQEAEHIPSNATDPHFYGCKAGILWMKQPPPGSRPQSHNIPVNSKTGPSRHFLPNPMQIFKKIMSPEIVDIIVRETNRKAGQIFLAWNANHPTQKKQWEPTNEIEMYAFFGLLLFSGLFKCATQPVKELWKPYHHDIYKATMSLNRFKSLLRFIRFDNGNTRTTRQVLSKSAAIDDIWNMLIANLESSYTPGANLTVDEQLFPFRGRTRFTQYIPSKPAKYGIKVWWVCDSITNYPLKGKMYTGKPTEGTREVNQGENVVMELTRKYFNTGRTVYCDNFFTSQTLAENLVNRRLSVVGTVRSNKLFVPSEFKKSRPHKQFETLFGYYEKYALCSYVPKVNKAVILLSTQHYSSTIPTVITEEDEPGRTTRDNTAKKPCQILDYNRYKAGVDTMDQMLSIYSCKRGTNRWPLAMFYNILDIAGLASYVIYKEMVTIKQTDRRRLFLIELATELVKPHMEIRATYPEVTRYQHIRNAMSKFQVLVPIRESQTATTSTATCSYRPLCVICNTTNKTKRKTRFCCGICGNAMCLQHGKESKTYCCDNCKIAE